MPKRVPALGCSLVLSRSEKEQEPYPRCGKCAVTRNSQSCHDATQRTPPKLLPLSPQGTSLPPAGKSKTPNRCRRTCVREPSQSPAVTALPEGEPRGLRMNGCAEHAPVNPSAPSGQLPLHKGAFFSRNTPPPAKLKAPPIRTSKGQSSTAPEHPTCSGEGTGEMPKRALPLGCSLVLSRSEKEQEPCSAPRKSCRPLQSTILS